MRWALLLLVGCAAEPTALPPAQTERACAPGGLDHPQALVFVGDRLWVGNTGYGEPWGAGSLAEIDVDTARVVSTRATPWQNPQSIVLAGDDLWVAQTGLYDFSQPTPRMATAGGLGRLNPQAEWLEFELALGAEGRTGGPVDLQVVGDRLFVTSGIAARAYLFDLKEQTWLRGPDRPIEFGPGLGLGSLASDGRRVFVVDYNSDRLHVLDGVTGAALGCHVDLGETDRLEGAKAPLVVGRDLYYVLDQSGLLRRISLDTLPDEAAPGACPGVVPETVALTGVLPNDLAEHDGLLYVVHSGENNVTALDRTDFRTVAVHVLPPGSNPWQVAFHPDRPLMAVTEWAAQGVTLVDLNGGSQRRLRCGDGPDEAPGSEGGPDPVGDARWADVVRSAPAANDTPHGDPEAAANGVRGGGRGRGGLDVFSLGVIPGVDDQVELCWSGARVHDGPGADLVVFENPFVGFIDPVVVEVSPDGQRWLTFPHDLQGPDESRYTSAPNRWQGFAGITPVWFHEEDNRVNPFGTAAGGDAFDLKDLGDPQVAETGISCVRLVSAQARVNPDTQQPFVVDPVSDGADIDGVYGRYLR